MLCYFFTQSNEQTPRHALWVTQQRHMCRTRGHGTRDGMRRGTHSTKWCELTGASNSMPLHPNHYFVWRNKKIPPVLTNGQASVPPGNVLAVSSVNKGHGLFLLLGGFQLPLGFSTGCWSPLNPAEPSVSRDFSSSGRTKPGYKPLPPCIGQAEEHHLHKKMYLRTPSVQVSVNVT